MASLALLRSPGFPSRGTLAWLMALRADGQTTTKKVIRVLRRMTMRAFLTAFRTATAKLYTISNQQPKKMPTKTIDKCSQVAAVVAVGIEESLGEVVPLR